QVAIDTENTAAEDDRDEFEREIVRQMDQDIKATGLKQLQGLIWQDGFESGELVAHVFDDVPVALQKWKDAGVVLRIYSSGSVHAQRLVVGHRVSGDLLPMFSEHYDTKIGGKREPESYVHLGND